MCGYQSEGSKESGEERQADGETATEKVKGGREEENTRGSMKVPTIKIPTNKKEESTVDEGNTACRLRKTSMETEASDPFCYGLYSTYVPQQGGEHWARGPRGLRQKRTWPY